MPLTPDDVSNKRFTPVRLREGYDMGEVDQFLDEVETELARLLKDNDDLRERLRVMQENPAAAAPAENSSYDADQKAPEPEPQVEPAGDVGSPVVVEAQSEAQSEARPEVQADTQADTQQAMEPEPTQFQGGPQAAEQPVGIQQIRVTTAAEASVAATRLLELATTNADQLVAGAQLDADQILNDAHSQAEQLESESRAAADQLEAEARSRSQMLDSETVERRAAVVGDLEKEKGRLNSEVESLRAFEREYRSRLKSYFTQQLAALDSNESDLEDGASGEQPARLRSLLGEE